MDHPSEAVGGAPRGVKLRPDKLVRLFLLGSIALSLWLAVSPLQDYLSTQDRAAATRKQLEGLTAEQRRLQAQGRDLSKGTGLEEQARLQGLIDPSERSFVIDGIK